MQIQEKQVEIIFIFSLAEETIKSIVVDSAFLGVFFNYISSQENLQLKQAAAVTLMRYIKDYWVKYFFKCSLMTLKNQF